MLSRILKLSARRVVKRTPNFTSRLSKSKFSTASSTVGTKEAGKFPSQNFIINPLFLFGIAQFSILLAIGVFTLPNHKKMLDGHNERIGLLEQEGENMKGEMKDRGNEIRKLREEVDGLKGGGA